MRLALGVLLGAAAGVVAMARRSPSGHRPPQPRYPGDQRAGPSGDRDEPPAHGEPNRPAPRPSAGEHDAARDERHKRGERIYWGVTGAASILATGATCFAAWFAWGAYTAALNAVSETRRQADIAQDALVASTRARLKITSVESVTAKRREGDPAVRFQATAAYRNFGQSPAQNIFLTLRANVTGAEPPPEDACEEDKATVNAYSAEVVFPQNDEGGGTYSAEMPVGDLIAQAAAVRAAQPEVPLKLSLIGCLTYRSAGGGAVHVTGFASELGLADADNGDGSGDAPAYKNIVEGDGPFSVKLTLTPVSAWAD